MNFYRKLMFWYGFILVVIAALTIFHMTQEAKQHAKDISTNTVKE